MKKKANPFAYNGPNDDESEHLADPAQNNRFANNIGQYNQYLNSKKGGNMKKKSKSMRNMRATVGAIQSNYAKDLDLQPLMSSMGGRDTRKSLGFVPGKKNNNLDYSTADQPAPPPPAKPTNLVPEMNNKAQFQTNLSQFDLSKSQSPNSKNPTIYKSSKNQPYMDKIVKQGYLHESKPRRMSTHQSGFGGGNSFVTNHKVDYKDFGTYVEDCKKHLNMAYDLKQAQQQQNVGPVTTFNLKDEKGINFDFNKFN